MSFSICWFARAKSSSCVRRLLYVWALGTIRIYKYYIKQIQEKLALFSIRNFQRIRTKTEFSDRKNHFVNCEVIEGLQQIGPQNQLPPNFALDTSILRSVQLNLFRNNLKLKYLHLANPNCDFSLSHSWDIKTWFIMSLMLLF